MCSSFWGVLTFPTRAGTHKNGLCSPRGIWISRETCKPYKCLSLVTHSGTNLAIALKSHSLLDSPGAEDQHLQKQKQVVLCGESHAVPCCGPPPFAVSSLALSRSLRSSVPMSITSSLEPFSQAGQRLRTEPCKGWLLECSLVSPG